MVEDHAIADPSQALGDVDRVRGLRGRGALDHQLVQNRRRQQDSRDLLGHVIGAQ
jgi:hypothetical protein